MIKVAFYDTKEYDKPSFERYGAMEEMQFRFLETKLNEDTVELARGCDAVCVFVNDTVNATVIDKLYEMGVKLIALRSAGYNNVDVRAAFGKIHVVHVPAYSPYAVAEHAIALLLTSVRRIHKAYNRTREFNSILISLNPIPIPITAKCWVNWNWRSAYSRIHFTGRTCRTTTGKAMNSASVITVLFSLTAV